LLGAQGSAAAGVNLVMVVMMMVKMEAVGVPPT
jgi:hypothetical protein